MPYGQYGCGCCGEAGTACEQIDVSGQKYYLSSLRLASQIVGSNFVVSREATVIGPSAKRWTVIRSYTAPAQVSLPDTAYDPDDGFNQYRGDPNQLQQTSSPGTPAVTASNTTAAEFLSIFGFPVENLLAGWSIALNPFSADYPNATKINQTANYNPSAVINTNYGERIWRKSSGEGSLTPGALGSPVPLRVQVTLPGSVSPFAGSHWLSISELSAPSYSFTCAGNGSYNAIYPPVSVQFNLTQVPNPSGATPAPAASTTAWVAAVSGQTYQLRHRETSISPEGSPNASDIYPITRQESIWIGRANGVYVQYTVIMRHTQTLTLDIEHRLVATPDVIPVKNPAWPTLSNASYGRKHSVSRAVTSQLHRFGETEFGATYHSGMHAVLDPLWVLGHLPSAASTVTSSNSLAFADNSTWTAANVVVTP